MTARYEIAELIDGLRIQVIAEWSVRERLLGAGIIGAGLATLLYQSAGGWWPLAVAIVAASIVFCTQKTRRSGVNVTAFEFTTFGAGSGRDQFRPRVVFTAATSQLKFNLKPHLTGSHRDGLYAVVGSDELLLLPYLDFQQTTEIIQAIEAKFPGLAELWERNRQIAERVEQELRSKLSA